MATIPEFCGIDLDSVVRDCHAALAAITTAGGHYQFTADDGDTLESEDLLARLDEIAAAQSRPYSEPVPGDVPALVAAVAVLLNGDAPTSERRAAAKRARAIVNFYRRA